MKLNSHYKFPETLELSSYLVQPTELLHYILFGVLVHSGSANSGHYYAFLRPNMDEQWYKFDDCKISKVTSQQAISDNFGGKKSSACIHFFQKTHSAYPPFFFSVSDMLIYLQKSNAAELTGDVSLEAIPTAIVQQIEKEREILEARKKELEEAQFTVDVRVSSAQSLQCLTENRFDLVDMEHTNSFRVKKNVTLNQFKSVMEREYNIPASRQQFW